MYGSVSVSYKICSFSSHMIPDLVAVMKGKLIECFVPKLDDFISSYAGLSGYLSNTVPFFS